MKVLVVDDEPNARLIAEMALGSLGHECRVVTDGAQAWDAYQTLHPDVVLSDWTMPGLSGPELCRNIRAQSADDYAYFIMVSVHDTAEEIREGMTAGADDYLVKPLDPDALRIRMIAAERVTALHRQLAQQRTELEALNHEITAVVRTDPLTGLGNRLALQDDLELLDARVNRYGYRYCLALLDVDHFKAYNDAYGHQAGDQALQVVASQLKYHGRSGDATYRYGGEEFLCILPEQSLASGTLAVERMRAGLERLSITHAGSRHGLLTVSAGLAVVDHDNLRPAKQVLKEADEGLYRAKRLGRNRVESAGAPPG